MCVTAHGNGKLTQQPKLSAFLFGEVHERTFARLICFVPSLVFSSPLHFHAGMRNKFAFVLKVHLMGGKKSTHNNLICTLDDVNI